MEKGHAGRRKSASRQCRLEYLLRGKREEEDHADVVHDEVQAMCDAVIAVEVQVCPHDRGGSAGNQEHRIVEHEPHKARPGCIHGVFSVSPTAARTAASRARRAANDSSASPTSRNMWNRSPMR
jgi:hypothetical protein